MQAQRNGTPMIISSGYIGVVEGSMCIACGHCEEVCQFHAITLDTFAQIDTSICMGCGVCVNHCPEKAIALVRDLEKPEPLEINELI